MKQSVYYSSFFLKSFRLLSLSPPPFSNASNNMFFTILCFVNMGMVSLELLAIYVYQHETFHTTSSINEFIDIVQVILPIVSHFAILIESLANRRVQQSLQQQMCVKKKSSEAIIVVVPTIMLKAIVILVLGIATELAVIASIYKTFLSFARSWYFRVWSLNVIRFQVIQLIGYVEWQAQQWQSVAKDLRLLKDSREPELEIIQMRNLRQRCLQLWQFNVEFNRMFAGSMCIMVTNYYVCGTIGLYWVLLRFYFACWDLLFGKLIWTS